MTYPKTITFNSDGNVLEFIEVKKVKNGEPSIVYKYVKSNTKGETLLTLTQDRIDVLIKDKLVIV